MKIIFICGSLEAGCDGVGDYTRKLACELIIRGNRVAIVALNDRHLKQQWLNSLQYETSCQIHTLRLSPKLSWKKRIEKASEFINSFNPDWISLQYVPFSFQIKGLPIGLGGIIKQISSNREIHIMFHELWLGMSSRSPKRHILWGWIQRQLIKSLIKKLQPKVIHTQNLLYQIYLQKIGIMAIHLPLFSNIPISSNYNPNRSQIQDKIHFVLFGGIHPDAPVEQLAKEVAIYATKKNIDIALIIVGRNGRGQEIWAKAWQAQGLEVKILGEQSPEKISDILVKSSIGLSTTPVALSGKSGSIAAMHAHGLQVICVSEPWYPRKIKMITLRPGVLEYSIGNFEACIENKDESLPLLIMAKDIAHQFLTEITFESYLSMK